jgi:hypothetical protein
MKKIVIILFVVCGYVSFGQNEKRTEGAHQAEMNTEPIDDNNKGSLKNNTLRDSRNVNDLNEGRNAASDTMSTENSAPGGNIRTTNAGSSPTTSVDDDGRDGTNTMTSATLNVAGSPIPGSAKAATAKPKANAPAKVKKIEPLQPVSKGSETTEPKPKDKKKKKR